MRQIIRAEEAEEELWKMFSTFQWKWPSIGVGSDQPFKLYIHVVSIHPGGTSDPD